VSGRPRKYKTSADLEEAINKYFRDAGQTCRQGEHIAQVHLQRVVYLLPNLKGNGGGGGGY